MAESKKSTGRLILVRHGQSEWNKENTFTGWVDIPLSTAGVEEAFAAGREIAHIPIDVIFTSTLIRGIMTAMLAMSVHETGKVPAIVHEGEWYAFDQDRLIPVICAWELNERMYGELQGKNKQQMREEYGDEQVHIWRRSFDVPPPGGESLKMTAERTLPYFDGAIVDELKRGKNVLVSAHGNSLRSIVMELDGLTPEEVLKLEIPTGKPLYYTYADGVFKKG